MKTYVWLAPEKLKFINENPKVLSLLYDLGLLPEEISARVRGYVEEETAKLLLQNRLLREGLEVIAKLKPKDFTPGQEHWEWGNFDDSFAYGHSTAQHEIGTIAEGILKEAMTEKPKREGPIMHVPGCIGYLCNCKPVFGEKRKHEDDLSGNNDGSWGKA